MSIDDELIVRELVNCTTDVYEIASFSTFFSLIFLQNFQQTLSFIFFPFYDMATEIFFLNYSFMAKASVVNGDFWSMT